MNDQQMKYLAVTLIACAGILAPYPGSGLAAFCIILHILD